MSKVVLVTGSARRVGAAIVALLHQHGYRVVVHCHRSHAEATALVTACNQQRADSAYLVTADLADHSALATLIASAHAKWGRLDALVNNAACFVRTPLATAKVAQWDNLFTHNLRAPFFLAQAAIPALRQQQGSIINITDTHYNKVLRDYSVYGATKAALDYLTKAMAKELAPSIRVNAVAPGSVCWPEHDNTLSMQQQRHVINKAALQRIGQPEHIAAAVHFLLTTDYITGQTIVVDGGRGL